MSEQVTPARNGPGTRRTLLMGAAAVGATVVLAACGDDGEPAGTGGGPTGPAAPQPTGDNGAPGGGGRTLAKVSDVPVGGGKIFAEQGVVVVQPTAGTFKGFSAICTHQQCPLANVDGGTINCTCHGSRFSLEDGSPKNGPATRPLAVKDIVVDGENISLA